VKERIHITKGRLVALDAGEKQRNAIVVVDAGDVEKERFVRGAPLF
jgi:hypothetical protein